MESRRRELIGAIEVIAVLVVVIVVLALAVWFLFFAHNPLLHG